MCVCVYVCVCVLVAVRWIEKRMRGRECLKRGEKEEKRHVHSLSLSLRLSFSSSLPLSNRALRVPRVLRILLGLRARLWLPPAAPGLLVELLPVCHRVAAGRGSRGGLRLALPAVGNGTGIVVGDNLALEDEDHGARREMRERERERERER